MGASLDIRSPRSLNVEAMINESNHKLNRISLTNGTATTYFWEYDLQIKFEFEFLVWKYKTINDVNWPDGSTVKLSNVTLVEGKGIKIITENQMLLNIYKEIQEQNRIMF